MNQELEIGSGERINIYDLLRVQFLMDTCLKDMQVMKKRMLNPNYVQDQVFYAYFNWYRRVIKNIRKFCRKVLRGSKKGRNRRVKK